MSMSVVALESPPIHRKDCACDACRGIRRRQTARWRKRQQQGVVFWVDAEPVRAHVRQLMRSYGMPSSAIAAQAGVSNGVLRGLLWGNNHPPSTRLVADNGNRLLAAHFNLDTISATSLINAIGTQRRAQGLSVAGYGYAEVARRLGRDRRNLSNALHSETVSAGLARAVRDLADELEAIPPPSSTRFERAAVVKARRRAERNNWVALAAWDDIDDPDAMPNLVHEPDTEPDEAVIAEALRGTVKLKELREVDLRAVIQEILRRGKGVTLFVELFGCNFSRARRLIEPVRMHNLLTKLDERGQLELCFLRHLSTGVVHVLRPEDPDAEQCEVSFAEGLAILAEEPIPTLCGYQGRPSARGGASAVDAFVDVFDDERLCQRCHRVLGPFASLAFEHDQANG